MLPTTTSNKTAWNITVVQPQHCLPSDDVCFLPPILTYLRIMDLLYLFPHYLLQNHIFLIFWAPHARIVQFNEQNGYVFLTISFHKGSSVVLEGESILLGLRWYIKWAAWKSLRLPYKKRAFIWWVTFPQCNCSVHFPFSPCLSFPFKDFGFGSTLPSFCFLTLLDYWCPYLGSI